MPSAKQVVDEIRSLETRDHLGVYWIRVFDESRDQFASEIAVESVGGDRLVVPWVVRDPGLFNDANSVMTDVVDVLESARDVVSGATGPWSGVDLVLLARRDTSVADASSPVEIPDWWPIREFRGRLITTTVEDLTWSVAVPLNDDVSALGDLSRLVYSLDVVLTSRLREASATPRRVQSLDDLVFGGSLATCLISGERRLAEVAGGESHYRPTTRPGTNETVVGRLWAYVNKSPPEALPKAAASLAKAVGLDANETGDPPLTAVLSRTANPIPDKASESGLWLLVSLRAACQLLTAGAHADEYPRFPVLLLRSFSLDLRRFLDRLIVALES